MKYHRQSSLSAIIQLFIAVVVVLADDVDYNICVERLEQEYSVFQGAIYFSLALTFFNIGISLTVLAKRFARNPQFAYRYHLGMASIKMLLGILLLTVLWPSCPVGCGEGGNGGSFCQVDTHYYLYPSIVVAVGLSWMLRGYRYYKIHQAQQEAANDVSRSPVGFEDTSEEENEGRQAVAMTSMANITTKSEGVV
jgi:uncharacterized membrane protein YqjE